MKKRTVLYLVFSFAFAWAVWIGVYLLGWSAVNPTVSLIIQAGAWAPALAILLVKLMDGENGPVLYKSMKPQFKGHIKWYLAAWLLPLVLMILGGALYFILFPGALDFSMSYLRSIYAAALPEGYALEPSFLMIGLVTALATSVTLSPLIVMLYSLGEEIGWRGFLFPALREKLGVVPAHILSGVIWGIWNAPLIVLMGQNYGFEYIGAPWLGVLAMCVFTFSSGVILSWLAEKSGSVWAAALCRGSIGSVASLPVYLLSIDQPVNTLLGPYTTGVIAGLPALIFAIVLMVGECKQGKTEADSPAVEAPLA